MQPTTLATFVSSASVLVGIVFGSLTLRQWTRTRSLSAAAELVHTIQTPEVIRAFAKILELPVASPPERVLGDADLVAAVYTIVHALEGLGVLVYHRLLPLHLVDHLVGGYVRATWARLRPSCEARREALGPTFAEWYQWLAEQLDKHPAPGKSLGAAVAYRDWQP